MAEEVIERYKNIFRLRNTNSDEGVDLLIQAFWEHPSNLLRHEICYALGQMRNARAIPFLRERLQDVSENGMVRHESAEALGAIGDLSSLDILVEYSKDPVSEVAQTCELAVSRIDWTLQRDGRGRGDADVGLGGYMSVDPAPPPPQDADLNTLRESLKNESLSMFDRYRAMFGLRNKGGDDAAQALCEVILADKHSPLLRHEIAYVLGQMQNKTTAEALAKVLADTSEHEMVRHEAAEALGCISPDSHKALLVQYEHDQNHVIAHSCQVALAMFEDDFIYV
eukprot:c25974_g1_i1.p1 GENE.c25974_g1_i1~~c25974_g1_i1.p1  ORF type:complete len:282 (-),score=58.67 c25974_g1_i1:39-884(-)